jgi:hypothetical protein
MVSQEQVKPATQWLGFPSLGKPSLFGLIWFDLV